MSDPVTRGLVALSSRRSFTRSRTLVALSESSHAMLLTELARATGLDADRQRSVLFGDGKDWSVERSPAALGLVRVVKTSHGDFIEITAEGRAEVALLRREPSWARGMARRRRPRRG